VFKNQAAEFPLADFEVIRQGIDGVKPKTFIELGTGVGTSTALIFDYLERHCPECEFWTIEIDRALADAAQARYAKRPGFSAMWGLTVTPEETTDPARSELGEYSGPVNTLRDVLTQIGERGVDIAFIDSRKGSSLAEFKLLEKALSPHGIIYCHDILNGGKGVEVLMYIQKHKDVFDYDVSDSSQYGMIRISHKAQP
jgi:predicted O-methyltransferase YrrM